MVFMQHKSANNFYNGRSCSQVASSIPTRAQNNTIYGSMRAKTNISHCCIGTKASTGVYQTNKKEFVEKKY